jgi:SpoVK/Ycf46/Vps4 family AAA+-type ATPase
MISQYFEMARSNSPCIMFIDQVCWLESPFKLCNNDRKIDSIAMRRGTSSCSENSGDRIVTCFLTELDGVFHDASSTVLLVGGT